MKRSKTIRLVALGSLPLVLSACGDRPTRIISETKRYQDVDYCVMDGVPRQVCRVGSREKDSFSYLPGPDHLAREVEWACVYIGPRRRCVPDIS